MIFSCGRLIGFSSREVALLFFFEGGRLTCYFFFERSLCCYPLKEGG